MTHKRVEYRTVGGRSVRVGERTLSGEGYSASGAEADAIRQLAGVRDSLARPAYFVILSDEKGGGDGQDTALTLTLPEGVSERQARTVVEILETQGHTLETANLLSDRDLIALDDVGESRVAHIRALGTANGYPAYQPPAE